MYQRRRARILLAVLVLLSIVLVTVDFRSDGGEGEGPLGRLRGVASAVLAPVQAGLATLVSPIGDLVSRIDGLFDLRGENAQLRAQLDRLEQQRLSYEDILRENQELRELLDMRDRGDFDTVAARVIGLGPSNFEWTVTLDVGSDDGVERDMVVINERGLVGRVLAVTGDTARVLLAVDPNFQAASRHAGTGENGVTRGNRGEPMVFEPLDPEAEFEVGDEIVTAPYSNGVFPAGIPIGSVEAVEQSAGVLSRSVLVRPFVNFSALSTVLVVMSEPVGELPSDTLDPDAPFVPPDVDPTLPEPEEDLPPPSPTGTETATAAPA